MPENNNKGVVLFVVLGVIIIVTTLSTVILRLMLSQSRLTHHQVSRIQAQYAAKAGMVFALEKLRTGDWVAGANCTEGSPCTMTFSSGDFVPAVLVSPSNGVSIIIRQPQTVNSSLPCYDPPGGSDCVSVTATYTYSS
jgi:Tfp pilus assembly protein PilX